MVIGRSQLSATRFSPASLIVARSEKQCGLAPRTNDEETSMDAILNLISVAGIWSSTALLAWGAALALEQILCAAHPSTRTPTLAVQIGDMPERHGDRAAPASSLGEPVHQNG
jgi:hypothetical protein